MDENAVFFKGKGREMRQVVQCGRFVVALGYPAYKKSLRAKNDAGLDGFFRAQSCLLRGEMLHFNAIDINL